jgi:hypothetical protein
MFPGGDATGRHLPHPADAATTVGSGEARGPVMAEAWSGITVGNPASRHTDEQIRAMVFM